MQKVRIVSLDRDKAKVVAALHAMGAIDLRKSKLDLQDDKPAQNAIDVSDSLIRVTGALNLLTPQKSVKPESHRAVDKLVSEVKILDFIDNIYKLGDERKELTDDLRLLEYAEYVASAFAELRIDFSKLKSERVAYRAFETDRKGANAFEKNSRHVKFPIELHTSRSGKKSYIVLVAYEKSRSIDDLYKGQKVNELDLNARYLEGYPKEILENVRARKEKARKRLAEVNSDLGDLSKRHFSKLVNLREMLEIEMQRADVSTEFKRTEKAFIVEGWVQKKQVQELGNRLQSVTAGRSVVEEISGGDELAPTKTNRPKFLQPFDYLVSFYSVQRSDEIDPTWIFIISFPIFYGLMVTDVGYGLASLALATWITSRTNPEGLMYNAAKLWQLNSIAAIFFGLLSNQWFGFQLNGYVGLTQGAFDWLKNTPELIAITVIFGIIQVILGLVIGIINSWHHGHKKMAVARLASILVVVFGTIAVAGAFFSAFTGAIVPVSAAIAVLSLLAAAALSGEEATEIVNLITHPLSYARLMGFGLGSVIIAFLIDMAFTPHMGAGLVGAAVFLVYLVIFIGLHFLNMTLSIFEGLVQGVRLNFVEFFSKFYIGNGIPFRPFSYKRVNTQEDGSR